MKEKEYKTIDGLKFAIKYISINKKSFIKAVIVRFISMLVFVVVPVLSSSVLANFSYSRVEIIIIAAIMILLFNLLGKIGMIVSSFYSNTAYAYAINYLHNDMVKTIFDMDVNTIEKKGTGTFVQRINIDAEIVATSGITLIDNFASILQFIGIMIAIFILCVEAFCFQLVIFILTIVYLKFFSDTIQPYDIQHKLANEKHIAYIIEIIKAHIDIKALNSEDKFINELEESDKKTNTKWLMKTAKSFNLNTFYSFFVEIINFLYIFLLVLFIVKGKILPIIAIVLYNYKIQLQNSEAAFTNLAELLRKVKIAAMRIENFFDNTKFPKTVYGNVHKNNIKGNIEFNNVGFYYEGENENKRVNVFDNLSFKIHAGEKVAFVGRSGCGKTTILNLIERFYDPKTGNVFIDGENIINYDKETLRGNITLINQNIYIFDRTIKENLKLIKPDLTDEEMIEACKKAQIHDEIMKFPDGYDTKVGEGGVALSGGQRQRIAFARVILKNTPIVMLDESTSALDNIVQNQIQESINLLQKDRTIIIVAHRLSTILDCDKIFYIEDGKVVASGNHATLYNTHEGYRNLYKYESNKEKN